MTKVRFKMRRNPDWGTYLKQVEPEYPYTVGKDVDDSLAGVAGRLVMQFVDGSAIEVTPDQVKLYRY